MDRAQDLESHDDIGRALEKARESILLMKKKMFRSHDLILQYNNKLKECDRLKGDLCAAREQVIKLKRENSTNLSKVVKLEMQNRDYRKSQQELEQKIEKNDIQIASDKSHLEQLRCKLKDLEEKQMEKEMEAELTRSALEVKLKELERESRALKKSQQTEVGKLEKSVKSPKEKKGKKSIEVVKETREMGVNTFKEDEQPQPLKPAIANKSVMTDEFYHIRNNPYPLFCSRCESFMELNIEKICKTVIHPPLVGNMSSSIRSCVPGWQHSNHNDSKNLDVICLSVKPNDLHRTESTRPEINLNVTGSAKTDPNESNSIDLLPHNFVSQPPAPLTPGGAAQETPASETDATALECDSLRREVARLRLKLKKQRTRKTSDSQTMNCCAHSHPLNYRDHSSSTHANPVPNVFPNTQADLMAEFLKTMMNFANERDHRVKATKVESQRGERTLRDKRAKSRKLRRMKVWKKSRNCGSGNWEINTSDFDAEKDTEISADPSDPSKPHLLRIKPSHAVDTPVAPFGDAASEISSPVNDPWEASFAETRAISCENVEKSPVKAHLPESASNQESAVKIPIMPKPRKRGRPSLIRDNRDSEIQVVSVMNDGAEDAQTNITENSTTNTRTRGKSLRSKVNERKSLSDGELTAVQQDNAANSSWHSATNDSGSSSLNGNARDSESGIFFQNSTVNESTLDWKETDHAYQSDSPSDVCSDSEPLECTNLRDRVEMQKRKRSSSPKAAKRRGRPNLLGTRRALEKNSIATIARRSGNSSTIRATRSLSRRKLTEHTECEDFVVATKVGKRASVSTDEPSRHVPVKQRSSSDVPKIASSPKSDEQEISVCSKISNETCKSTDEKWTDDRTIAVTNTRLTRRSAVEKLAQSKVKRSQVEVKESVKSVEINRLGLKAGVKDYCRLGSIPAKRKAANDAQLSVDSRDNSPDNEDNTVKAGETSSLPKVPETSMNDVAKSGQ